MLDLVYVTGMLALNRPYMLTLTYCANVALSSSYGCGGTIKGEGLEVN